MGMGPRGVGRLRHLNAPVEVGVRVGSDGVPTQIVMPRKKARTVEAVQEKWRIDEGWWSARPVSRIYWRLVLDNGQLVTVFFDLIEHTWKAQRA
jgi:hypothetical protein